MAAAALALPAGATAAAGDVYAADEDYGTGTGAVLRVPPSGPPAVVSTGADYVNPSGMVLAPDGTLLVADYDAFAGLDGAIFRVDPRTGVRTTLFTGTAAGARDISDLAFGPDGKLYATGFQGPTTAAIFRIDPVTGAATPIALESGDWSDAGGIAVLRDGTIYFTDYDDELFKLSPAGVVTEVADNPLLAGADGIAVTPDERTLYVAAFSGSGPAPNNRVVAVDAGTGTVSPLATVDDAVAIALRTDRSLLFSDTDNGDAITGIRTLTPTGPPIGSFNTDASLEYPHDIVIEPQRCGGKLPTLVGTTGKDSLRGSAFADVISTLGGKDTVNALAGNDVVCGGAANDKLKGGPGKDRLIAGKGKKDTCTGGKGKDVTKGCEAGKP